MKSINIRADNKIDQQFRFQLSVKEISEIYVFSNNLLLKKLKHFLNIIGQDALDLGVSPDFILSLEIETYSLNVDIIGLDIFPQFHTNRIRITYEQLKIFEYKDKESSDKFYSSIIDSNIKNKIIKTATFYLDEAYNYIKALYDFDKAIGFKGQLISAIKQYGIFPNLSHFYKVFNINGFKVVSYLNDSNNIKTRITFLDLIEFEFEKEMLSVTTKNFYGYKTKYCHYSKIDEAFMNDNVKDVLAKHLGIELIHISDAVDLVAMTSI